MATNGRDIPVSPDRVWAVLSNPSRYSDWVVGAKHVRDVEGHWPEEGSAFHHTVGVWPLRLRDNTSVVECDPPRRLVLQARARPFGRASGAFNLVPSAEGTHVSMTEMPTSPAVARLARPLLDPLTHARNAETLRRLAGMVAGRAS